MAVFLAHGGLSDELESTCARRPAGQRGRRHRSDRTV